MEEHPKGTYLITMKGHITAVIDGHEGAVEVNGLSISVSGLDAGEYDLIVTTVPDANHKEVTKTVSVTVNKKDAIVNVSDISFTFNGSGTATVTVDGVASIEASIDGSTEHL